MKLSPEQFTSIITAVGTFVTMLTVVIAWLELRAKQPALAAQARESEAVIMEKSLAEFRLRLQEGDTRASKLEEQLALKNKEQYMRDIEQDKLGREQATKIEALEAANKDLQQRFDSERAAREQLQKDLDTEKAARRKDVEALKSRVADLENENKALREENQQVKNENAQLKAGQKPRRAAKKIAAAPA